MKERTRENRRREPHEGGVMRTEDCSGLYEPQTVFQFNNGVSLRARVAGGRRRDDVSLLTEQP